MLCAASRRDPFRTPCLAKRYKPPSNVRRAEETFDYDQDYPTTLPLRNPLRDDGNAMDNGAPPITFSRIATSINEKKMHV